jgi:hypothetical protein
MYIKNATSPVPAVLNSATDALTIDLADPAPCIPALPAAYDGDPVTHAFVVRHGCHFQPAPLPPGIAPGPKKECFANAAQLAGWDSRLVYVEGVARRFCGQTYLPFCHAWCSDLAGNVIDPTWANPPGTEYFGVPFQTRFVLRFALANRRWTVIHPDWLDKIQGQPVSRWLHPRFNPQPPIVL